MPTELPTVDLSPMVASLRGFGQAMGTVLESMQGLTQGLSEARLGAELGGGAPSGAAARGPSAGAPRASVAASGAAGAGADAAAFVRGRLQELEAGLQSQLQSAGQTLQHSERLLEEGMRHVKVGHLGKLEVPLHPLPSDVLDAAATHVLTSEIRSIQTQLAITRRELKDVVRTKAYRYEMAYMRNELHSFLFGGGQQRPPLDMPPPVDLISAQLDGASPPRSAHTSRPDSRAESPGGSRALSPSGTERTLLRNQSCASGVRAPWPSAAPSAMADAPEAAALAMERFAAVDRYNDEAQLLPARLSSANGSAAPSPRPSRPASASIQGRTCGGAGCGAPSTNATTTEYMVVPSYQHELMVAPCGGTGTASSYGPVIPASTHRADGRFALGAGTGVGYAACIESTSCNSARAAGGPAPPTRPRPRSATVRTSPRMKGLIGTDPAAPSLYRHELDGPGAMGRVATDGHVEPGKDAGMLWSSRSHFAQHVEARRAGGASRGSLSSRPPSAGIRPSCS